MKRIPGGTMEDDRLAAVARALGHPARVRILRMLVAQDACMGAEIFAGLPLAQSTVSQHLAVLKRAGLVHATPKGTSTLYCVAAEPLAELSDALLALSEDRPVCPGKDR